MDCLTWYESSCLVTYQDFIFGALYAAVLQVQSILLKNYDYLLAPDNDKLDALGPNAGQGSQWQGNFMTSFIEQSPASFCICAVLYAGLRESMLFAPDCRSVEWLSMVEC